MKVRKLILAVILVLAISALLESWPTGKKACMAKDAEELSSAGRIHEAAKRGDVAEVNSLLAKDPKLVKAKDNKNGQTPLHLAASMGHEEVVGVLIAKGAEVNEKEKYGQIPLHSAAYNGHKEVVEVLIANGARVNEKDRYSHTPLHLAAHKGQKEVVEVLIANGARVNEKDSVGRTPLYLATGMGHEEMVEVLRKHGGVE